MINTTDDRTLCCSNTCEKRFECGMSYMNNIGTHYVEDYSSFGTGTYTDNVCKIEHWCGKLGDYKMFKSIKKEEEKIPFPFQYLEQYLRGELIWDAAIDNTMDEVYRLIEEYISKNE